MTETELFLHYVKKLFDFPGVKVILGSILWIANYFLGDITAGAIPAIVTLWAIDFVTGFRYARKDPNIIPTSKRFRGGWYKLGLYLILLSAGYQCTKIDFGFLNIVMHSGINGIIQGGLGFTEIFSIAENVDKLGRLRGVEIKFVRHFLNFLWGKYNAVLGVNSGEGEGKDNGSNVNPL